jgi:putative nucleotidyltransferase with HDIG domain
VKRLQDEHDRLLEMVVRQAAAVTGARRAAIVIGGAAGPRSVAELGSGLEAEELAGALDLAEPAPPAPPDSKPRTPAVVGFDEGVIWLDRAADHVAPELLAGLGDLAGAAVAALHARARLARGAGAAIEALAALLELRDGYAASDAQFMVDLAQRLGNRLELEPERLGDLATAARLHDIGKVGVPDRILHKPGRLDPEERLIMQRHPIWGADTLAHVPGLERVADIVRMHHERTDGTGYPVGLHGDEVPVESMIIAVGETFRALTSERPYRRALQPEQALAIITRAAGTHFDPAVVQALREDYAERGITPKLPQSQGNASRQAAATRSPAGGAGHRLPAAFQRLEGLPALTESRDRLLDALDSERVSPTRLVAAIESDVALVIAVLRLANERPDRRRSIAGVPDALTELAPHGVEKLASQIATVDFFEHVPGWPAPPERMRLHAVAVQRAAARIAGVLDRRSGRDELVVAALLHDIGKLVLAHAYPGYPDEQHGDARTPDERVRAERHELGLDHAVVGGVLLRRWGLPDALASAVEGHHQETPIGDAAIVRLADLLAHYAHGQDVEPRALQSAAAAAGVDDERLRMIMYEPDAAPGTAGTGAGARVIPEACPLTPKELAVVRELATGKVYREIAETLQSSSSTVRTHLHNAYRKLGVNDRAQAVLLCAERGWL